ncbi:hypothetical protein [Streptomyces sp. NPDC002088]
MNTTSARRPDHGSPLPSASMPALVTSASTAFCLGRVLFPAR